MMREEQHDDVIRMVFTTPSSRSMGFDVSTYAVRGMVIDSACSDVGGELQQWLSANGPRGLIVTHYHEDHAGNVERIAQRGLPLWIAPQTLAHLTKPHPIGWYRRWCWGAQPALTSPVTPFVPDGLELIQTPGHSNDHHVVWDATTRTVFGADLFLGVKVRVSHPPHREDVRAQMASLRRVIALNPVRYFDAHRGLIPNPVVQLQKKLTWMEETVAGIDALINQQLDDRAIVKRVFGGEDRMGLITFGDYSRKNFVASVRATASSRTPLLIATGSGRASRTDV